MSLALQVAPTVGVTVACEALGVSRASLYRRFQADQQEHQERACCPQKEAKDSALGLSAAEREKVLFVLQSERFVDASPRQVWATLLDEGTYLCSVSTMYRLLRKSGQLQERRRQRRHGSYKKT